MTKEEKAIDTLFYFKTHFAKSDICREHFDMAIKALEQQSCEDAILKRHLKCYADCKWQENYICQCDSIELGTCGECLMYSESEDEE